MTDEPEFVPWQDHEWPEHCPDEDWDSLVHHFTCAACTRPIFIWDMS